MSFILTIGVLFPEYHYGILQGVVWWKTVLCVLVTYVVALILIFITNCVRVPLSMLADHHRRMKDVETKFAAMSSVKVEGFNRKAERQELENSTAAELKFVDCQIRECFISGSNTISRYNDIGYDTPVRVAVATFRLEPSADCPESVDVRGQIEILDSNSNRAKSIFDGVWLANETSTHMRFLRGDPHTFILGLIQRDKLFSYEHETRLCDDGLNSILYPELEEFPGEGFIIQVTLLAERRGKNKGQTNFSFDLRLGENPTICLSPQKNT